MKHFLLPFLLIALVLSWTAVTSQAADLTTADPCGLVPLARVQAAFSAITGMEQKNFGPHKNCSYLDKFNIPALTVTTGRDPHSSAHAMMENLGDGYRVVEISGLGDEAAMAISRGNPKYNIKGGGVAELYIKKGDRFLLLAPMRIKVRENSPGLEKLKSLARDMLAR